MLVLPCGAQSHGKATVNVAPVVFGMLQNVAKQPKENQETP